MDNTTNPIQSRPPQGATNQLPASTFCHAIASDKRLADGTQGIVRTRPRGLLGLQDEIDAQTPQASIKGSRRIQPTRVVDRYSHSDSLQLTGMSQPGEGWLRVRAATEEEDDAKTILKKIKKVLAQINEEDPKRQETDQAKQPSRCATNTSWQAD